MFRCFRPRSGKPVVKTGESFFEAVSDQLPRVGVKERSAAELKTDFVESLRAAHQGVNQSGISIRENEIENREEVFQRMVEFLERDLYIITTDGNFKHYRFKRLTGMVTTGCSLTPKRCNENRTVVLELVEDKYYQSMECYIAPCQLIEIDPDPESNTLQIVPETLDSLTKVAAHCGSNQIIAVCVVGTYRSGKSTLLNDLIEQEDGFSTSDSVEAHTRGVWACLLEKGDKCMLYLDTEGIHNPKKKNIIYIQMLLWSLSVCSEFMFNYKSAVGEDIIKALFNLVHQQIKKIRSNTHPMFRILLRDFDFNLHGISPTEYVLNMLTSEDGDLSKEKGYFLENVSKQKLKCYTFEAHPVTWLKKAGKQRSELESDTFAEVVLALRNDLQQGNVCQTGDCSLSLKEWMQNMQQIIITINIKIKESKNKGEIIDLSQCVDNINRQAFSQAFRQFRQFPQASKDYLCVEEFVTVEKESWKYFEENKVGNVDEYVKQWQDEVRNSIKLKATSDCKQTLDRMYTDKSLENYLFKNNQNIWNLPLDKDHFIVKFYFTICKEKIQIKKTKCFDAAIKAVARQNNEDQSKTDVAEPIIETVEGETDARKAEETKSKSDNQDGSIVILNESESAADGEEAKATDNTDDHEDLVLLSESDKFSTQNTRLQLNLDEFQRTQDQIHAGDRDDTDKERIEHQQNLRKLLNYISIQNVFESEACMQLIRDYSKWHPIRKITIQELSKIMNALNLMQLVGSSVNVGAGSLGAAAGVALITAFFVPIMAPVVLPLSIGTLALSSSTVIVALVKLGLTWKKANDVTKLMAEDHKMTVSFYQSIDRLIRESQRQPPRERIESEVPSKEGGFAIFRGVKVIGDVAEIAVDTASAGGVAIGRGVAVGLGAIGIVFDIGMVGFSIYDLTKGSKHKMSEKIANIVAKLERDSDIINNICYYTALHYIELELQ